MCQGDNRAPLGMREMVDHRMNAILTQSPPSPSPHASEHQAAIREATEAVVLAEVEEKARL